MCTSHLALLQILDGHRPQFPIGERKVKDQLNLERAMGAHVRFGGHFVQVRLYELTVSENERT